MAFQAGKGNGAPGGLQIAKAIIAFIIGGIVVHLVVMFLDYFLMLKPLFLDLRVDFAGSIFSMAMFPMIMAYGLLSLAIYLLWKKKKRALLFARDAKIQREKVDDVLNSMQSITGLLAEHIAMQNSKILGWIEFRNRKGKPVSEIVEKSSEKIAKTLQALSEISFVMPFSEHRPEDRGEIVNTLKNKLREIHTDPGCRPQADRHL